MKRLLQDGKERRRSGGGRRKLAKYDIPEVRDKYILRRKWSNDKMKIGFREMEPIDDSSKGDFHSMVGMGAILEWVKE